MGVTFVIGRAGSGKTLRCHSVIVEALRADPLGPRIYWLVPRQATFNAERQLTCASGLAGFCRARVVSFEWLGEDIFTECGGAAIPQVTGIGRQMILGHLLRELTPRLGYFRSSARQPGLAVELDGTFAELERAGKTTADLAALIDELSASASNDVDARALLAKLSDVHLLYGAYSEFLGQERLDQHRRLDQILALAKGCGLFQRAAIYVDGFAEFTDFQRRMLGALAQAGARMEIAILMDPCSPLLANPHLLPLETGLFHKTESAYRKLWFTFHEAGVPMAAPLLLQDVQRFVTPALRVLEREFHADANGRPTPSRKTGASATELRKTATLDSRGIDRIAAPDRAAEVDAVSREIRLLLAGGFRLREVVVLARDLEPYQSLIATSFDEHDIPYFVDRRRPAAHHPLLEFLRSALRVARFDWHGDSVFALLKTGLAGVSSDAIDELENYVILHRVRGEAWESTQPWTYQRKLTLGTDEGISATSGPPPGRVDLTRRRVAAGLSPLVALLREGQPLPVRDLVTHMFALLERFGVRQTLSSWITEAAARPAVGAASSLDESGQHEQVWAELVRLFEEMVDLLGEHRLSGDQFAEVLENALERFDLALAPPTVDQVLVGQIDRTICPPVRAAFVLGLNEREFPAVRREETVLSDRERRELGRRNVQLDPDSRRQILDEPMLGYIAFTRSSERLFLTRAMADEKGRPTAPSSYWIRIQELFPEVATTVLPARSDADIEQISTPRQMVGGVMRWIRRSGESADNQEAWPALYQWLATRAPGDLMHPMLHSAWPALRYANQAFLSNTTTAVLFPSPLSATIAQLETFAACPFRHFTRHGLRLESRRDEDVTMADLSQVYHRVLEQLINLVAQNEPRWDEDPLPITDEMIRTATDTVGRALRGEFMLSSARNRYLLHRIQRTLVQLVASQRELMKRTRFRPKKAGVAFGEDGAVPALQLFTPKGETVSLEGKIDRIDLLADGDQFIAFDYRLAAGPLSLQKVHYGLSLGLVAHLLVVQANGPQLAGRPLKAAAAFYLQLLRSLGDVAHPDEALDPDDPRYLLAIKPRGVFDSRSIGDLDAELAEGRSTAFAAYINKQGTFGYRSSTDVAESDEFSGLLEAVRQRIGALGDEILAGRIAIAPFRLNTESPCPHCEFRGVCRFETSVNHYTMLMPLGREQVLEQFREKAPHA